MRLLLSLVLLALLAAPVLADSSAVEDGAGLFKEETLEQASKLIENTRKRHDVHIVVKTVPENQDKRASAEKEAEKLGHRVKVGRFPMRPNAKAVIEGHPDGFTKMVSDADTDVLLGVHIIGPHATELIAEAALARLMQATTEEIAITVHPHPTVSEVLGEAAHDLLGHAIHI